MQRLGKQRTQLAIYADSVEREYDKIIKKKGFIDNLDKIFIQCALTSENDSDAIQWIIHSSKNKLAGINLFQNKYVTSKCQIYLPMFAIHNKNREMAKILLTADSYYKNKNWKEQYKTITPPKKLIDCLPSSHNHDFSFLVYIIAAMFDKADKLQQLYTQQIPTNLGQSILIEKCAASDASCALDIILKNESARNLVKEDNIFFFAHAFKYKSEEVAQKLIENNLYDINKIIRQETLLDRYSQEDKCEENKENRKFLEKLGAKTWREVQAEQPCSCCFQ